MNGPKRYTSRRIEVKRYGEVVIDPHRVRVCASMRPPDATEGVAREA